MPLALTKVPSASAQLEAGTSTRRAPRRRPRASTRATRFLTFFSADALVRIGERRAQREQRCADVAGGSPPSTKSDEGAARSARPASQALRCSGSCRGDARCRRPALAGRPLTVDVVRRAARFARPSEQREVVLVCECSAAEHDRGVLEPERSTEELRRERQRRPRIVVFSPRDRALPARGSRGCAGGRACRRRTSSTCSRPCSRAAGSDRPSGCADRSR